MAEVNVSVAVRVRPLLASERVHSHQVCVKKIPRSKNQILLGKDRAFTFDNLFWWNSKQKDIYTTTVLPLVDSCFQGYNATVFAYGQTGSGKTHTILGVDSSADKDIEGIIPRAVDDIFLHIKSAKKDIHHMIKVSYVEIYLEEVRDLLEADPQKSKEVFIREDQNGTTVIAGAKEETCNTASDVLALLNKGSALRHTGATQMNELSSRSHAIFTIHIVQTWPNTPRPNSNENNNTITSMDEYAEEIAAENFMSAKFHFVDLAGSERANRTGNTGERFKESIQINTGLLALGNVISALSDPKKKAGHIPYRDSKITRLLKDSLGGNAQTLMIACISPSATNFDESLNTLKYATRAKNIKNNPVVNRDSQQILMEEMQVEIETLKQQLQSRSSTRSVAADNQIDLERELSDLQDHCSSYQHHLKEAARHLKTVCGSRQQISKGNLNEIRKWLENASKIGIDIQESVCLNGGSMMNLQSSIVGVSAQLEEYRKTLESDERMFAKKDQQLDELKRQVGELEWERAMKEEAVSALENIRQQQSQKLIEQNVVIEQLQDELQNISGEAREQSSDSNNNGRYRNAAYFGRAQSVPQPSRPFATESMLAYGLKRAHSSPPLMSVEKIMAGFRARNHMMTEQIEEEDEVEHLDFNQEEESTPPLQEEEINETTLEQEVDYDPETQSSSQADPEREIMNLRESTMLSVRNIKQTELRAQNANMKIKELSINIRMKEELIKELVKTGNDAEVVKRTYASRIQELERKVQSAKRELLDSHKVFEQQQTKADEKELQRLKTEYEHKLRDAKAKVQSLQKRQKEMEKMSTIPLLNNKKIQELEKGISTMRQMQEDLQKKLKEEQDVKRKLETDLTKDKSRIKELETKNENQQKIVKRKTEEVAAFKKKLRNGSKYPVEEANQRKWLDEEVKKALEQQEALKQLDAALRAREAAVKKKEDAIMRKSILETKKMRSSQVLSSEVIQVASKLTSIDQELSARSQQLRDSMNETSDRAFTRQQQLKRAIERLQNEKTRLNERRKQLENKLQDGGLLEHADERELIELDEAVEAYTAVIEWQNDEISHSDDIRKKSVCLKKKQENDFVLHFKSLPQREASLLLIKCFERIIELRDYEQSMERRVADLEDKCSNRDLLLHESETALHHIAIQHDRKISEVHQEHEKQTRLLLEQISEEHSRLNADDNNNTKQNPSKEYQKKMEVLEKDLFYYKTTSRDLRKRLRELVSEAEYPHSARSIESDHRNNDKNTKTDTSTEVRSSSSKRPRSSRKTSESMRKSTVSMDEDIAPISPNSSAHFKQGLKQLPRHNSIERISERDAGLPLSPKKSPSSSSSLNQSIGSLRRAQMQHQHPTIASNSVEYLQFQELLLPRNSPVKKGSQLIEPHNPASSHPPQQTIHSNLITASLSMYEQPSYSIDENIEPDDNRQQSAQIRISKKEVKRLHRNEVNQRKLSQQQNASFAAPLVQDSLDNRNPWSN